MSQAHGAAPPSVPETAAPCPPPGPDGGRKDPVRGVVPVLAFAGIAVAVMQTLLVPVIDRLPVLLSTAASDATWVVTATLLSGAVATPIMGRLGDLYGKRRMLLVSLAVLVVRLPHHARSPRRSCPWSTGRAVQGFAMGAIPLGISIMRDELPPERLGSAMALMSSSLGVGGALGLPAGRARRPAHRLARAVLRRGRPRRARRSLLVRPSCRSPSLRTGGRFDLPGALGLSAGLVALLLAIIQGRRLGLDQRAPRSDCSPPRCWSSCCGG